MCGIAGYFGLKKPDNQRIETALKLMVNRGPDHQAHVVLPAGPATCVLLHSRLSIVDLNPRSHQPFARGGCTLVYNGEIYNHRELRKDLEKKGAAFTTESDTEVVLQAYLAYGDAAVERFEGMWAFALYDDVRRRLLLSRDRFGEKPLYVHTDDRGGVYFGSEIKFIAALRGRAFTPNMDHLKRYLVNGYKAIHKTDHTFFEDVVHFPAATNAVIEPEGALSMDRYWRPRLAPDPSLTFEDAVERARAKLFRAVELRLRADVKLAFCMSGGVDSNALIGIARKIHGNDLHGFTIANLDPRYEEKGMVDAAVAAYQIRHTNVSVTTENFLPQLRALVRYHDAPVYTITYYAHWLLMKRIAEAGYRVSVSGTGADELFSGYYDHHLAYLFETRGDATLHAAAKAAWAREVRPYVRNPHLSNPDLFIQAPAFRDHIFLNSRVFSDFLTRPWFEPFAEETYADDLLRNRMMNEMFHEAVPALLHEDDLNAMHQSIENRSPYLDRDLFETCAGIPTRLLVRNGKTKSVLREAVRGIVPDEILDNPRKVGFNAPIFSFLDTRDPAVRSAVLDPQSPAFEIVRRESIEALLAKPALPNSESKFLFNFINVKFFLEEFAA